MVSFKEYESFLNLPNSVDQLIGDNYFWNLNLLKDLESSKSIGGDTGWEIKSICMFDHEALVGFIPMFIKHHSYGEYVFDWSWAEAFHKSGLNYYPKMISAIPFSPITGSRIIADNLDIKKMMVKALEKILLDHKISSCHILFPNQQDAFLLKEMGWLQREGVQFRWENKNYNSFEQFLSNLSHNKD